MMAIEDMHFQAKLKDICESVRIDGRFGFTHPDLQRNIVQKRQKAHKVAARSSLDTRLTHFLYRKYYANIPEGPTTEENENIVGLRDGFNSLLSKLTKSNPGKGYFEPKWKYEGVDEKGIHMVSKAGLTLWISDLKHIKSHQSRLATNTWVSVKFPKHCLFSEQGFYYVYGDKHFDLRPSSCVRMYFHIQAEGGPELLNALATTLNERGIPFHFKILSNSELYIRYDTAVLYFDRVDYHAVRKVADEARECCGHWFLPEVPLMTKRLGLGFSIAEEPYPQRRKNESFGLNRCRLIAEALLQSHQLGHRSARYRYQAVIRKFEKEGLDINRPYLNILSEDIYQ